MTKKTPRDDVSKPHMPCPCLKLENSREALCINGEEVHDINFVDLGFIPTCMLTDKIPDNSLCLNIVYSDDEGFIRCGTSKRLIKVRNYHINIEDYLDALRSVKEFNNGDLVKVNSCPECLYKTIVSKFEVHEKQDNEEIEYVNATGNC